MGQKRGLTGNQILSAAIDLAEKNGLAALNIQDIAASLDVRPPSLYNHLAGLDGLKDQLAKAVLGNMETTVRDAAVGKSREDALVAMAYAYRGFANSHPELYKALALIPRSQDPSVKEAAHSLGNTLRQVLAGCELESKDTFHFVRIFRATLHGFASMEQSGFFQRGGQTELDETFRELVRGLLLLLEEYKK